MKVGRKLYSKEKAEVRLLELEVAGITLEIMGFNQACGLQNKNSDTKGKFENHLSSVILLYEQTKEKYMVKKIDKKAFYTN